MQSSRIIIMANTQKKYIIIWHIQKQNYSTFMTLDHTCIHSLCTQSQIWILLLIRYLYSRENAIVVLFVLVVSCCTREAALSRLYWSCNMQSKWYSFSFVWPIGRASFPYCFDVEPSIWWVFTFFQVGGNCHIRMQDFQRFFFVVFRCKNP